MTDQNTNSNEVAANINVIEQAKDKVEDAKTLISKAEGEKEQFNSEFGDVDEETQKKIEEQAKQNGTTALEEAQKLFEEKKQKEEEAKAEENEKIQEDVNNYMAGAIFG